MKASRARSRRAAAAALDEIVTPGEEITSDPQWMRCVSVVVLHLNIVFFFFSLYQHI